MMADFNGFSSLSDGSPMTIYSVDRDWTTWIGLNNDVDLIPTEISLYKDHPDRDWANEQTFESGRYKDLEWAQEPDWFRIATWWRGWIPIGGGTDFAPWYLDLDALAPYVTISDRFAFTDDVRKEMRKSIRDLQAGVDAILEEHVLHSVLFGPPSYDDSVLDGTFPTLRDLRIETANAKRAALDRAGWICWWTKATPDSFFASPDCVKDLLHFGLSDAYIYRGFVIDLCRDWQAIDLPFWLYYNIPVFYAWGFDEKNDQRFSRLDPRLLALADEDNSLVQPASGLTLEAELVRSAAASWNFDDYLMHTEPDVTGSLSAYDSHSKFTVIDFEGWGRRFIHEDQAPAYATRFHFTTSTDGETGHPIVVFWRWKPRQHVSQRELLGKETRREAHNRRSELWYIREAYAPELAPTTSRTFHPITGAPTHGNTSSLEERLAERAWDSSSVVDTEEVDKGMDANSETEGVSRRSLQERIESGGRSSQTRNVPTRPSLSNMTTWKNFAQAGTSRSRRSRSPTIRSPLLKSLPPHERPAQVFRAAYKELAGKLTYTDRIFATVDTGAWNAQLLAIGYLHVPDWRVQVRLRFFANCVPTIRHVHTILSIAIEHRLSFQIAIRTEDFHFFEAGPISHIDQRLVKTMYKSGFSEPQLSYSSPSAFINAYLGKVADVLRRPHARAFIGLGGPFSWLAQCWAGDELVARFMEGPSIQVTRHFSGQSDSGEDRCLGIHWDCVSDQEIEFLFGYIPADKWNPERWLYPPVSILEDECNHWSGEWNVGMEEIFRHITSQVTRNPPMAAPKSRRGWIEFLRSYNRGRKAPKFIPTERHFLDAKGGLQAAGLPVNWNRQKINSIIVPEYSIL
jgi:hypothetical protein